MPNLLISSSLSLSVIHPFSIVSTTVVVASSLTGEGRLYEMANGSRCDNVETWEDVLVSEQQEYYGRIDKTRIG